MSSTVEQPLAHNTRSAIQIVWSCVFIIFTCTWTAIHPNVPSAQVSSSKWRKLWWRVKIMLWTLMLPEMMVCWATFQWKQAQKISTKAPKQLTTWSISARPKVGVHVHDQLSGSLSADASSNTIKATANEKSQAPAEWTRTHSYFLLMGGFSVPNTGAKGLWTPVPVEDVLDGTYPWPAVKEADILNLTKGEALAKTLVVLQVIWFVSQLCGRVIQHLAITELEIMTLAYAIICAMLYMLWFSKPYDVQRPIFLDDSSYPPSIPEYETLEFGYFLVGAWLWIIHGRIVVPPSSEGFIYSPGILNFLPS
ncbi:hypothetical protein ONZ45_g9094 [Pleurotus djamor]|nr:hypothetical protein ONZ45_g9094 [Pleurotus djamor]